jgi:signal transduction histidine kinase
MDALSESLRLRAEKNRRALQERLDSLHHSQIQLRETLAKLDGKKTLWFPSEEAQASRPEKNGRPRVSEQVLKQERRRISRELHDEFGQALTLLRLGLKSTAQLCSDNAAACQQLGDLLSLVDDMHVALRELTRRLRPAALDESNLLEALSRLAVAWQNQTGIEADLEIGSLQTEVSPDLQAVIYRIVQEALTNVARHARAQHADIVVQQRDAELLVIVEDDGVGCPTPTAECSGMGLQGIQERLAPLGGSLDIETSPGQGTTLFVRIPLTEFKETQQ